MGETRDDEALLDELADAAGGIGNIRRSDACATRLRLAFADPSRADAERLGRLEGAAGLLRRGEEFQIVFGFDAPRICRLLRARMEP